MQHPVDYYFLWKFIMISLYVFLGSNIANISDSISLQKTINNVVKTYIIKFQEYRPNKWEAL